MKGVFSFSFQVETDIAPTAQLLIYTILPNGEIVADTQKLDIENCFPNKVGVLCTSTPVLLSFSLFEVWEIIVMYIKSLCNAPKTFLQSTSRGSDAMH